jgi:pimeloyl-ACP methyl ester carboxylesterase
MNRHALADHASVVAGALLTGGGSVFADSAESPPVGAMLEHVAVSVPTLEGEGTYELTAETPVGTLDATVLVAQWVDPTAPTVVYHHGSGESPLAEGRFATNTFRDIFLDGGEAVDEFNLVAIRAPYHALSTREYARALRDLERFVAMLATSVAVVDEVVTQLAGSGPVFVAGISLGGWVTTLHRTYRNTATGYVPLLAGARLGDLFADSGYRRMVGGAGAARSERLRATLNYDDDFQQVTTANLHPLLARYDQYIEFETETPTYEGYDVVVLEKGHVTATLDADALREHVVGTVRAETRSTAAPGAVTD